MRNIVQASFISFIIFITLFSVGACHNGGYPSMNINGDKTEALIGSDRDCDPDGGADNYAGRGDNSRSAYYGNPDFYSLASDKGRTLISHFKTMQQTTEWSCGDICALLLLHHFGCAEDLTEWDLAVALGSMTDRSDGSSDALPGTADEYEEYGTRLEELYRYFDRHPLLKVLESSYRNTYCEDNLVKPEDPFPGCDCGNLYPTFASPAVFARWLTTQLKSRRPVLVEWSDWDGHWTIIIGIDNNGTPDFMGDDILIFADPYDTSDHRQDGYNIAPLERFFCMWKDRAIAPKPYQLQPYLVVDRRGSIKKNE